MQAQAVKQQDSQYIAPTYARNDLVLVSGSGCVAQAAEGDSYLDFTSGIGVNSLGWCHPAWVRAVCEQTQTLQHTSNLYYTQPAGQLAQALCTATGMQRVFFGNSGAEANEGAIKAARKYSHDRYGDGRHTIISLQNSFHGRTMATLTATGQDVFHQNFDPFLDGFLYVPANDFDAFCAAATSDVCAIMLELIQGEGGVVPLDAVYVKQVAEYCAARDILIIVDEVQTGIGRTGKLLACEHFGLQPDIITLAKGLGGGLPIGAVLLGEKTSNVFGPGDHGSTFGGNPVVCAGANVVMETLTPLFLAQVTAKGAALRAGLEKLPHVKAVVGLGLMLGIEFENGIEAKVVLQKALERGLLCLTAKTKLRLLPPLVVTSEEINIALEILREVLEEL